MSMSQLEHFRRTMAHERSEGFIFYAKFTPDLERRVREKYGLREDANLFEHFGMFDPHELVLRAPENYRVPDFSEYYADIEAVDGSYINEIGMLHVPGSMHHFTHYISPLRNVCRFEEIENYCYPDVSGFSEEHMAEEVRAAHAQGRVVSCWVGHMYEEAWQIRGYEEFLMDMVMRPEWCEFILDKITERNLIIARAAARAGADYLVTGDDVANQITLMFDIELWRKMIKSRWAKVYAAAKEIKPDIEIWYHSDGNISDIIPELIEIGVTILNPVQPECLDPVRVKKM